MPKIESFIEADISYIQRNIIKKNVAYKWVQDSSLRIEHPVNDEYILFHRWSVNHFEKTLNCATTLYYDKQKKGYTYFRVKDSIFFECDEKGDPIEDDSVPDPNDKGNNSSRI